MNNFWTALIALWVTAIAISVSGIWIAANSIVIKPQLTIPGRIIDDTHQALRTARIAVMSVQSASLQLIANTGDSLNISGQALTKGGEDLSTLSSAMQGFIRAVGMKDTILLILIGLLVIGMLIDSRKDRRVLAKLAEFLEKQEPR